MGSIMGVIWIAMVRVTYSAPLVQVCTIILYMSDVRIIGMSEKARICTARKCIAHVDV